MKLQRPNVLLVVMDTARSDYVKDKQIMPQIHKFAKEGTWFTNTFTNAPWTLPSHSSLFTGKYPSDHGATAGVKKLDSETTLMSLLSREGYHTVSFSNNPWISPDFGFDDFDEFIPCWQPFQRGADLASISQKEGLGRQLRALVSELTSLDTPFTLANAFYMKFIKDSYDSGAALTNFRCKQWLDHHQSSKPFFAFVNYMEPHLKYDPPRKYRQQFLSKDELNQWNDVNQDPWAYLTGVAEMDEADFEILKNLYQAELSYLDARLGQLFDFLRSTGELDSTVVIVTGDHGEHLGEHQLMDHQYSLSDSLLHVPLLIRYPEEVEQGTQDNRLVELRDLFATILSLAGVNHNKYCGEQRGTISQPIDLTKDDASRSAAISEYISPQPAIDTLCTRYSVNREVVDEYDRALRTIRTPDRKFVQGSDGSQQIFAITQGKAEETQPLNESHDKFLAKLDSVIGEFSEVVANASRHEIAGHNKQRLEDLGYL
jgi:arylsulfatase A-like enzyme